MITSYWRIAVRVIWNCSLLLLDVEFDSSKSPRTHSPQSDRKENEGARQFTRFRKLFLSIDVLKFFFAFSKMFYFFLFREVISGRDIIASWFALHNSVSFIFSYLFSFGISRCPNLFKAHIISNKICLFCCLFRLIIHSDLNFIHQEENKIKKEKNEKWDLSTETQK